MVSKANEENINILIYNTREDTRENMW